MTTDPPPSVARRGARLYAVSPTPCDAETLAAWRALMPVGTSLYGVARPASRVLAVVFAVGGKIRPVPPLAGTVAGYRYSRKHQGFRLRPGDTCAQIARALGLVIHSRESAFVAEGSL